MIGKRISHFSIVERLGAGTLGVVYRAHDQRYDRDVALKVLREGIVSSEEDRERLRGEVRELAAVQSAHVAAVHDFGSAHGVDFLVMEYVEGETLEKILARGPLAEEDVTRLGIHVADALAAAHLRSLVHRDLEPKNVVRTSDGAFKVLDFGLARWRQDQENAHDDAAAARFEPAGAVAYMAPELLAGHADTRSDLFSLGVMMYEAVTGRRPFEGRTVQEVREAIRTRPPAPPGRTHSRVSPELEGVVLRALQKDPQRRYPNAAGLRLDLERMHAPLPVASGTGSSVWPRALTLAAVALLAGVLALDLFGLRRWLLFWVTPDRVESVAVLSIAHDPPGPEASELAGGVHLALLAELRKLPGLRVIDRTSVLPYGKGETSRTTIGERLDVDALVEGGIVRRGDRLQLTARLYDASTDRELWHFEFERDVEETPMLVWQAALGIAREIQLELTEEQAQRLGRTRRVERDVLERMCRAWLALEHRPRRRLEEVVLELRELVRADPELVVGHSGIAECLLLLEESSAGDPGRILPKVREASSRALALDDTCAAAFASRSVVEWRFDLDAERAEASLERALELEPSSARTQILLARLLTGLGRKREARDAVERARRCAPLAVEPQVARAWLDLHERRYDAAVSVFADLAQAVPDDVAAHAASGLALSLAGRHAEALEAAATAVAVGPTGLPRPLAVLGLARARAGDAEGAREALAELAGLRGEGYAGAFELALVHVALEDAPRAFRWLDRALVERDLEWSLLETVVDAGRGELRSDPRFGDLERRAAGGE